MYKKKIFRKPFPIVTNSFFSKISYNSLKLISEIIKCIISKKFNLAQVSIAWLLNKKDVASPVVGCTKISQVENLAKAVQIKLSEEDMKYLEELYRPHKVVEPGNKNDKPLYNKVVAKK